MLHTWTAPCVMLVARRSTQLLYYISRECGGTSPLLGPYTKVYLHVIYHISVQLA